MELATPPLEILLMFVASYLNMVLYTTEIGLVIRYFKRPCRPRLHKTAVGIMLTADTLCTVALCVNVAVRAVVVSTPENAQRALAPFSVTIFTTYISATIEQLFLCNLFYLLTHNRAVGVLLLVMIVIHVGFSWASAILTAIHGTTNGMSLTMSIIGTVTCAATDITIGSALSWKFWTMMERSPLDQRDSAGRTGVYKLVHRTLVLTVCSGVIVASTTLIIMIFLLNSSLGFIFFWTCQGRVYALTLLGNFLVGIPHHRSRTLAEQAGAGANGGGTLNLGVSSPVFHIATELRDDEDDRPNGEALAEQVKSMSSQARSQGTRTSRTSSTIPPRISHLSIRDQSIQLQLPELDEYGGSNGDHDSYPLSSVDSKVASGSARTSEER
uniref:DUF6534 domain-containing protein n=1 Tax=Mycena chlorophos TaxID=658473 RepID=A0ABQ0LPN3_MYCCL|nr:predicted protein [Mycena chlorophos]